MEDLLCVRYRIGARITLPGAPVDTEDCFVTSHVLDAVREELIASSRPFTRIGASPLFDLRTEAGPGFSQKTAKDGRSHDVCVCWILEFNLLHEGLCCSCSRSCRFPLLARAVITQRQSHTALEIIPALNQVFWSMKGIETFLPTLGWPPSQGACVPLKLVDSRKYK